MSNEQKIPTPPAWATEYPPLSSYIEWDTPDQPTNIPVKPRAPVMPPLDIEPLPKYPAHVYVDGACHGNPGPGGWGVYITQGNEKLHGYGGAANTTNNGMELMAAIVALEHLKPGTSIVMYLDSQYVRKGITEWIKGWKSRGWKAASGQPVKNVDLWKRLDAAVSKHSKIEWKWVKGHSGNLGNEMADTLATSGANLRKDKDTVWMQK